jgi:GNAT superfamily N-acetyltransferase
MITIEQASEKPHLNDLIQFQILMAKETEGLALNKDIVTQGVKAVFEDPRKGSYYVALKENELVGSLLLLPEWSDWRNGNVWWIHSVFVRPRYRGKKIYSQMYQYLKEMVMKDPQSRGLRLYVDKRNEKAQRVYTKLGMDNSHYELFEWLEN